MEDCRKFLKRKEADIVKEDKDGRRKQASRSAKKERKAKKKDLFLRRLSSRVSLRPSLTVLLSLFHYFLSRHSKPDGVLSASA